MIVGENTRGKPDMGQNHEFGAIWAKFHGDFTENDQFSFQGQGTNN